MNNPNANGRSIINKGVNNMNTTKKYIIQDWTGAVMNFGEFYTFQDAWDFILNKFPNDEDRDEYFVETKEE